MSGGNKHHRDPVNLLTDTLTWHVFWKTENVDIFIPHENMFRELNQDSVRVARLKTDKKPKKNTFSEIWTIVLGDFNSPQNTCLLGDVKKNMYLPIYF